MTALTDSYVARVAADLIANGYGPTQANVARHTSRDPQVAGLSDTAFSRFSARVAREVAAQLQEAEDIAAMTPVLVDLGWVVSVNEVGAPMVDEVARIVREELDAMAARLAARGLPGVGISGMGR